MKSNLLFLWIGLFSILFLSGCGVSQADYDQSVNDLTAAQTRIADLEAKLAASQAEYDSLYTEAEQWTANRDMALVYEQIAVELMGPAIVNESYSSETISNVQALVEQTGDSDLKAKFDAWAASPDDTELLGSLLEYAVLKIEELLS